MYLIFQSWQDWEKEGEERIEKTEKERTEGRSQWFAGWFRDWCSYKGGDHWFWW